MPSENLKNDIELKPSTKLISHIVFLKEVEKGTAIGYSRKYIAPDKRKIATIPLGYADGIRRNLSNNGNVIINGKCAPIVGNICMDNFMVDVTGIDAKVGDKVYAIDFIKRNSLEYLVQIIIPKEFDDVYTVLNNYSALEINYLIRDLKRILCNGDKVSVISDYLSYCLDDKKIKENMSKDFMKTDLSRVKVIH